MNLKLRVRPTEIIQKFPDKTTGILKGWEIFGTVQLKGQEGAQVFKEFFTVSDDNERYGALVFGIALERMAKYIQKQAKYGKPNKIRDTSLGEERIFYEF